MLKALLLLMLSLSVLVTGCGDSDIETGESLEAISGREPDSVPEGFPEVDQPEVAEPETGREPDSEGSRACLKSLYIDQLQPLTGLRACKKASSTQLKQVNVGNSKRDEFLSKCYRETKSSCWCDQLVRPNPASINQFRCTYGQNQKHQLIHPDEKTWKHAIEAVKIVEEFEKIKLTTKIIYNWWRPEPYNKNVGGAASRHPFGTSVDVRFDSKKIQNEVFRRLCKMRRAGRIRAIGYYKSTAIHIGVGDNRANTWGKACP